MNKSNDSAAAGKTQLTARQREIMEMVCRGMTSDEIGIALVISKKTVEAHRYVINARLGAQTSAHAAAIFMGMGE